MKQYLQTPSYNSLILKQLCLASEFRENGEYHTLLIISYFRKYAIMFLISLLVITYQTALREGFNRHAKEP
ncbi:hypothetical protein HMPREF1870_01602 [Bacteroidales bacterium KA00344]|nr:hypothetical protein HMPREF1870_01602 [Bacteroidales bacterium KA00344]